MNKNTQLYIFEVEIPESGELIDFPTKNMKLLFRQFAGKRLTVTFKKASKKRSLKQLGYYWGCIITYFRAMHFELTGEIKSPNSIHEALIMAYKGVPYRNPITGAPMTTPDGQVIMTRESTSSDSTEEQEDYHEYCRQVFYLEFFESIPLPQLDWRTAEPLCFTKETLNFIRNYHG